MLASSFPNIPRTTNVLVSHFHICILQPDRLVLKVDGYRTFKYRSRPNKFSNTSFPLCILQPSSHVVFLSSQTIFEILPHPVFIVVQLVRVHNSDFSWPDIIKLVLYGLSNKLLWCYLNVSSIVIFNFRHFHRALGIRSGKAFHNY